MDLDKGLKILIVALLILVLLQLRTCSGNNIQPNIEVERYTDTTYVTHIDTIEFVHDTTITKTILEYTYVTIQEDSSELYSFQTKVKDSLIDGDIVTDVVLRDGTATLIDQSIKYKPLFPKYIYQKDSIFIKDSIVVTKYDDKLNLLVGANLTLNVETIGITPTVGLQLKNKSIIELGYDPFNKTVLLGTKFKLRFKK